MSRPKIIDYKYINRDGTMYVDERFINDSYAYMNELEKALNKACNEIREYSYGSWTLEQWKEWCMNDEPD